MAARCAHYYWGVGTPRPSHRTELGNFYIYVYFYIYRTYYVHTKYPQFLPIPQGVSFCLFKNMTVPLSFTSVMLETLEFIEPLGSNTVTVVNLDN